MTVGTLCLNKTRPHSPQKSQCSMCCISMSTKVNHPLHYCYFSYHQTLISNNATCNNVQERSLVKSKTYNDSITVNQKCRDTHVTRKARKKNGFHWMDQLFFVFTTHSFVYYTTNVSTINHRIPCFTGSYQC